MISTKRAKPVHKLFNVIGLTAYSFKTTILNSQARKFTKTKKRKKLEIHSKLNISLGYYA